MNAAGGALRWRSQGTGALRGKVAQLPRRAVLTLGASVAGVLVLVLVTLSFRPPSSSSRGNWTAGSASSALRRVLPGGLGRGGAGDGVVASPAALSAVAAASSSAAAAEAAAAAAAVDRAAVAALAPADRATALRAALDVLAATATRPAGGGGAAGASAKAAAARANAMRAVAILASSCSPRDAADAVLRPRGGRAPAPPAAPSNSKSAGPPPPPPPAGAVVDVGANGGWPVTRLALQRGVSHVVAVEPNPVNLQVLRGLPVHASMTAYTPVAGAVADERGVRPMTFHTDRDDWGCFTCLDKKKPGVVSHPVEVYTVDGLLAERVPPQERVLLLKTDTQGYEAHVLAGAAAALAAGRVAHVLVEYDPRLLGRRETGLRVLTILLEAHFGCVHLAFTSSPAVHPLWGAGVAVTADTAGAFHDWAVAQGGYTDLLCVHESVGVSERA